MHKKFVAKTLDVKRGLYEERVAEYGSWVAAARHMGLKLIGEESVSELAASKRDTDLDQRRDDETLTDDDN